jgi:hypothetical protein
LLCDEVLVHEKILQSNAKGEDARRRDEWREREMVQDIIKGGRSVRKENLNELIGLEEKL